MGKSRGAVGLTYTSVLTALLAFGSMSFVWSAMGFLVPNRLTFVAEYYPSFLAFEIGGHFAFGFAVALIAGDLSLALLSGGLAVVIDADHMLSVFVLPVLDRTAHSVSFAILSALVLGALLRKGARLNPTVMGVTIGAFLSHLSYDTLLNNGNFPILTPFSFSVFNVATWTWPLFELGGVGVVLLALHLGGWTSLLSGERAIGI